MPVRHCVLIPAYNEKECIEQVVKACLAHCPRVLVVDDASQDDTAVRASDAGAIVLRHSTNAGKGAALATGLRYLHDTRVQGIVTLDGDGQHDPDELPRFFKRADKGDVDIIVGSRMENTKGMPLIHLLVNRATSRVVSVLSGQLVTDSQSGYRWIGKGVWERLGVAGERFDAETELLINAGHRGFRIAEIPIPTIYRDEESQLHPLWDTLRFLKLTSRHIL